MTEKQQRKLLIEATNALEVLVQTDTTPLAIGLQGKDVGYRMQRLADILVEVGRENPSYTRAIKVIKDRDKSNYEHARLMYDGDDRGFCGTVLRWESKKRNELEGH
jgi:hypothetical protein